MALHIGQYGDVLMTLHWDVLRTSYFKVLRTSVGDVPWRYIEDLLGTSIGHLLRSSSGRPRDVILPSGMLYCFRSTKYEVFHKGFLSKCDQIRSFLWIWSHLLKKSLMENFIFWAVLPDNTLITFILSLFTSLKWSFLQKNYYWWIMMG